MIPPAVRSKISAISYFVYCGYFGCLRQSPTYSQVFVLILLHDQGECENISISAISYFGGIFKRYLSTSCTVVKAVLDLELKAKNIY